MALGLLPDRDRRSLRPYAIALATFGGFEKEEQAEHNPRGNGSTSNSRTSLQAEGWNYKPRSSLPGLPHPVAADGIAKTAAEVVG
jgi:hypothetical protein